MTSQGVTPAEAVGDLGPAEILKYGGDLAYVLQAEKLDIVHLAVPAEVSKGLKSCLRPVDWAAEREPGTGIARRVAERVGP